MRRAFIGFLTITVMNFGFLSCHSNESNTGANPDTSIRTAADTAMIPGTPGPSGSQPGPGDTTQPHRDSLKRAAHLSDTSGKHSGASK